jgi:hypothetical protein
MTNDHHHTIRCTSHIPIWFIPLWSNHLPKRHGKKKNEMNELEIADKVIEVLKKLYEDAKAEIEALKAEIEALKAHPVKELHLSLQKDKETGELLAVTYTDDEHRIVEVLWQKSPVKELNDGGEPVKNATYWKRQYNLMATQNDNLKSGLYHANEQIKYLESHPVKELTREDRLKLIGTLKWAEDLLREAGHDEAVSDAQDCLMILRKASEK